MLARTFLSAKDLKISELKHDALIRVLDLLERDEVPEHLFNMNKIGNIHWNEKKEEYCGSPGCILGWAQHFHQDGFLWSTTSLSANPGLVDLFMFTPGGSIDDMTRYNKLRRRVTREMAAMGLRNYLTTGNAQWNEILGETK